jgi:outer membrane protein OmpA-like peptidoglycan-associated protein
MLMKMKKSGFFLLVLLISAPGCGGKKQKVEDKPKNSEVFTEVNIPVAGDDVKSFFDEDIEEFVLIDNAGTDVQKVAAKDEQPLDDFSWVEEAADNEFKTVYFGFDRHDVAQDQQDAIQKDIELAQKMLAKGENPTIVIEGHSCHSAGSRTYNLALSEKRAKAIADRFVAAGVPRENVKIVARGSDVPAHDKNGKVVTGDREQQWPNRRSEIHVIYS